MSFLSDLRFCLKPRCPVCREGRLLRPWSLAVMERCESCGAALGRNDVGDGAAVFLIFLLGFTVAPAAWFFELAFAPPLWAHAAIWGLVLLGLIVLILPAVKAYVILLEYRHRK